MVTRRKLSLARWFTPVGLYLATAITGAAQAIWVTDCASDRISLYTPTGVLQRTINGIYPGGSYAPAEFTRNVAQAADGTLWVYNGTFNPYLAHVAADGSSWTNISVPGFGTINDISYGGIAVYGRYVFLTSDLTNSETLVRYDTITATTTAFGSGGSTTLNLGLDGLLYVVNDGSTSVSIYDPVTLALVRQAGLAVSFGTSIRGVTALQSGHIIIGTWDGYVMEFNPDGSLVRQIYLAASNFGGAAEINNLSIGIDGSYLAGSRFGDVYVIDSQLLTYTRFNGGGVEDDEVFANASPFPQGPLVINPVAAAAATFGTPFALTVPASTFSDTTPGVTLSYSASGLPSGLTFNSSSLVISGTPLAAGTYTVVVAATDNNALPRAASAVTTLTINKAAAAVTLGNLTQVYAGAPRAVSVLTSPASLNVQITYNGSSTPPTQVGNYVVAAAVNDSNYAGSATGLLVISKATPVLTWNVPSPITYGQPLSSSQLNATVPVSGAFTYSPAAGAILNAGANQVLQATFTPSDLVDYTSAVKTTTLTVNQAGVTLALSNLNQSYSGLPMPITVGTIPAGVATTITYNGSTTAPTAIGTYAVAAMVADPNYAPVSTSGTLIISPALPVITFPAIGNHSAGDPPITLAATASDGLPITYTVLSGPALLTGNQMTLTGIPGTVVVQAAQGGGNGFSAASTVVQSFSVTTAGPTVFHGFLSSLAFAAELSADLKTGLLLGMLPTGEGFTAPFSLDGSGNFATTVPTVVATGSASTRTFRGQLVGPNLNGTVDGLGLSFSAQAVATGGITALIDGLYSGALLGLTTGTAYVLVDGQGGAYVWAAGPGYVNAGNGTIGTGGAFNFALPDGSLATGTVSFPAYSVSMMISPPAQNIMDFVGTLAAAVPVTSLVNLSCRDEVETGQNVLISGFVVDGPAPKPVLIRAIGPGLAAFGVPGTLAAPALTIFDANSSVIAQQSTGWSGAANAAEVSAAMTRLGAFALAQGSNDEALLLTLSPGLYTAQVSGVNGTTGIALVEMYDASLNAQADVQRLVNVSARGFVSAGAGTLTGGFVVSGNVPKRVLIRGAGPALAGFGIAGALAGVQLSLFSGPAMIAQNSGWDQTADGGAAVAAAAVTTGAFPFASGSKDAAMIYTLVPGSYTAQVTGAGGSTGVALVEIYEIK